MQKAKILSAVVLALAAGGAMAQDQAADATVIPANIQFDGYCDGMTGLTTVGKGATGTWVNLDCAGASAVVGGPQGRALGIPGKAYIMGSFGVYVFGTEFTWVIASSTSGGNTFAVYSPAGDLLNKGTWSAVAANSSLKAASKSTVSR